jgi:hypothetical protein
MKNLSILFKAAHKLAKAAHVVGECYRVTFGAALRIVISNAKKLATAQAKVEKMNIKFKFGTKSQKDFAIAIIKKVGAYVVFTKKMVVGGKLVAVTSFEEAFAYQMDSFGGDAANCIKALKEAFYADYVLVKYLAA